MMPYDDAYATCDSTYATLRVYPGAISPEEVTERLGIEATDTMTETRTGEPLNGWFLSSKTNVASRDVRRHIDWLLDKIDPAALALVSLPASEGVDADVACFWDSAQGHGGPILSPVQMKRLASLDLDIWFDVYLSGDWEEHGFQ